MKVTGLTWLGTRAAHFHEMVSFGENVLGLERVFDDNGVVGFELPDGSLFEVFAPGAPAGGHPPEGVVGGFQVEDIEAAHAELERAGVEVTPLHRAADWAWAYFRAPDDNLYEIVGAA